MIIRTTVAAACVATVVLFGGVASAATSIPATTSLGTAEGDHDHSILDAGVAFGYWFGEVTRGTMEFDVSGQGGASAMSLDMTVGDDSILIYPEDDGPYIGTFDIFAYDGDGVSENADYFLTSLLVYSGDTTGLSTGDLVSYDVSGAIGLASSFLGFVIVPTGFNDSSFAVESTFVDLSLGVSQVPVPAALPLIVSALGGLFMLRRKQSVA